MNRKPFFPVVVSLMLVACSDPPLEITAGGGGSGSSASSGAGSPTGSGSTSSGSSSSSTGTGIPGGETVTITMDSFDIPPGGEVFKCQNFANPFGGDVILSVTRKPGGGPVNGLTRQIIMTANGATRIHSI